MTTNSIHASRFIWATAASFSLATLTACNPLIYGDLVDQAHVKHFDLSAPVAGKPWGPLALRMPASTENDGHLFMLGESVPVLTRVRFSPVGDAVPEYATADAIQDIMFPLTDLDKTLFGGVAQVPAPASGDFSDHVLLGVVSSDRVAKSRIVRLSAADFTRTDPTEKDIEAPQVGGEYPTDFGKGLAAINLEAGAAADDFNVEVAIGSDRGVFIFDSVGANTESYLDTRWSMLMANPGLFSDTNEPQGFHFTYCEGLAGFHALAAGRLGPGGTPAFVASQDASLTLITDVGVTNLIGAPVYDCFAREVTSTSAPSESFGASLFVDDLDGDGSDDLFVGDPLANRIDVYIGKGDGLPSTPDFAMIPVESDTVEFGFSIGRADLGGGFGSAIVVGAPGSSVDGEPNVGRVYVYPIIDGSRILEEPVVLEDQQPKSGSRHGMWVGGIYSGETSRDELIVVGNQEGRVHLAVSPQDPRN